MKKRYYNQAYIIDYKSNYNGDLFQCVIIAKSKASAKSMFLKYIENNSEARHLGFLSISDELDLMGSRKIMNILNE